MTAFLLTGCTCAMTFGGGLLALRLAAYRGFIIAFAAGALVAGALMDVVPDAIALLDREGLAGHEQYHELMLACTIGYLVFYLVSTSRQPGAVHTHQHLHPAGLLGAAGLGVHGLLDGFAIGEAFHAGPGVGWTVAGAVVAHKFADGVSIVGILVSIGRAVRATDVLLASTALAPLLGLVVQSFFHLPSWALSLALATFAGVFLYLGASLTHAAHHASRSRWLPLATVAGVLFVYVVYRVAE